MIIFRLKKLFSLIYVVLTIKSAYFLGFIVSTATLAALLIGSVVALTFFIWQLKKKKQRVENGR